MLDFANSALDYEKLISKKVDYLQKHCNGLKSRKIRVCGKGKLVFVKCSSVNWSNAGEELLSLYTNFELRRWIDFCDEFDTIYWP